MNDDRLPSQVHEELWLERSPPYMRGHALAQVGDPLPG